MDNITKEERGRQMAKVRGKNTKPEVLVRKYLFQKGLRYRLHDRRLPGTPDIVLRKYKTVIFVHGCFWHGHEDENCKLARMPKSNVEYWEHKIEVNRMRDAEVFQELKLLGWNIVIVWECQLKGKEKERTLERVYFETIYENGPNNFAMDICRKKRSSPEKCSDE